MLWKTKWETFERSLSQNYGPSSVFSSFPSWVTLGSQPGTLLWVELVPLFLGALRYLLGCVCRLLAYCHQAGSVSGQATTGHHLPPAGLQLLCGSGWLLLCPQFLPCSRFSPAAQMDLTPLLEKPPHPAWLCLLGLERAPFATEGLGLCTSQGGKRSLKSHFGI